MTLSLIGKVDDVQLAPEKPQSKRFSSRAVSLLIRHTSSGEVVFEWINVTLELRARVTQLAKENGLLIGQTFQFWIDQFGDVMEFKTVRVND